MTGAVPQRTTDEAITAAAGTVTDDRRTVVGAVAVGVVLGLLAAWVLVPFAGLERAIAVLLGGVAGLLVAGLGLVVTSYAQQLLVTARSRDRQPHRSEQAAAG
jgi:hypothetical protein